MPCWRRGGWCGVTEQDIFATQGVDSYTWSSMVPEQRAAHDREAYERDVAEFAASLAVHAVTDEQVALVQSLVADYQAGYLSHYGRVAGARSRVASTAVTGGSGFNTRRNNKSRDAYAKRVDEFLAWQRKFQADALRTIRAARTPSQVDTETTQRLIRDADRAMLDIAAIDSGRHPGFDRSSFVASLCTKLHREARAGHLEPVRACLRHIADAQQMLPKPAITARNRVWRYLDGEEVV